MRLKYEGISRGGRSVRVRQTVFAFLERRERLDRRFKVGILIVLATVTAALLAGTTIGRYAVQRLTMQSRRLAMRSLGLPPDRSEIEAEWRLKRQRGVEVTSAIYREVYADADPRMKRLLDFAGLDPAHAVLRWGNYHLTLLLPGSVFTPDETGRSYRMRPNTRSIWLKGVTLPRNLPGFFLVPDSPELPALVKGTGAFIVKGSVQTTNSWGLRGPEPDPTAPLRGLILGDSNMQGLFVGDDETPPEYLRRDLERRLKTRVSLVNTGVLGYSPEQFYHCLREYGDRFRPHFVHLTFCPNDFGDGGLAFQGIGDWAEGQYWFEKILHFCRVRKILCVISPVPSELQITAVRAEAYFPGAVSTLCRWSSVNYCNPLEEFIDAHLMLRVDALRHGRGFSSSPLYNGHLADYHFSAKGAAVWGRAVGRRIASLLELRNLAGAGSGEPRGSSAQTVSPSGGRSLSDHKSDSSLGLRSDD